MKKSILFFMLLTAFPTYPTTVTLNQLKQSFTLLSTPEQTQANHRSTLLTTFTNQDTHQLYHIHFQQYYQKIPIYSGYLILHSPYPFTQLLQHADIPLPATGKLLALSPEQLGPQPQDFIQQADRVLSKFKEIYPASHIIKEDILPMIYIDKLQHPHWAYKISLQIQEPNQIPRHPIMLIDAVSGQSFLTWDDLKTIRSEVIGVGYGGNHKTGSYQYGQERPALAIKRDEDKKLCYLENTQAKIIHMHQQYTQTSATFTFPCLLDDPTESKNFWTGSLSNGYDLINGAYSPSNDALYFASVVKSLYNNWYHIEPIYTSSGQAQRLVSRVHYGYKYTNAFWDGKTISYGDGDDMNFYPMVSLGITAHEISHGFTQQHANLVYIGESGAINEAFSDMASVAVEYYANSTPTWQLGADILKPESDLRVIRYLDHPSQDGKSFETIPDYQNADKQAQEAGKSINVHRGSGVFNRLFYLIATSHHWTVHKAFDVMVSANLHYWTPYSDFQDAGCGVVLATKDLGYDLPTLYAALEQIGVDWESC